MATASTFSQDLKQQADIVRIIGDYIPLKKAGAQNFTGLCPFHKEKSPSFSVHATRQFFHCFGCGASGDVFTFVQKIENITFPEAIRRVAEKMDIPVPRQTYAGPGEALEAKQRGVLLDMHEKACTFFEEQLRRPEGARAREYLAGRGLSEETLRRFRIGYAPDSGFLLRDRLRGMADEELLKLSGLMSWKQEENKEPNSPGATSASSNAAALYSKFRNRVMFPICNEQGKVIAFTGRTLDVNEKAGPKYLNSPETPIYSKGRVLFNLDKSKDAIRHLGYAILVEGNVDCISVFTAGFQNVIATSGTAFSEAQVRLLSRFTKQVVVNFDPDTAGAGATERSIAMLVGEEFQVKVAKLQAGLDPDLFVRKLGSKAYADVLMSAPDYFNYLTDVAIGRNSKTPQGRLQAAKFLLPYIKLVPSPILQMNLATDAASKLGIDMAVLRSELRPAKSSHSIVPKSPQFRIPVPNQQLSDAEKVLIFALMSTEDQLEARASACHALQSEHLHQNLPSEAIISSLLEFCNQAGSRELKIDDLESLAPEMQKDVKAILLVPPEEDFDADAVERALIALRRKKLLGRKNELASKLLTAERNRDTNMISALLLEKLELDRKLSELQ